MKFQSYVTNLGAKLKASMATMNITQKHLAACIIGTILSGAHLKQAVANPLEQSPRSAADLVLTHNGVGPVTNKMSINKQTLKKLFPSFSIKEDKGCDLECTEGYYKIFLVRRGDIHLFTVAMQENTEKIAHIDVHDPSITTSEGFRVGSKFEIRKKHPDASCSNAGPEDPVPYCYFKGLDNLRFTFTPYVDLASTKDLNQKMRNLKVALITWESR